jgi:hypothetical protein
MAELDLTSIAAASIATPSTGVTAIYTDATTKRLASKNDAGTVSDYVDLTSTQTLAGKTFTTPNIGAATGTSLAVTAGITTSSATSAGIGYATGSGGAVTQLTSRTTGVTLSKLNGAITLFTAAGSATYQSFTVTNTAVAVTDNIIISQKSGTDTYIVLVTNISAGSFKVTFATTGGTTSEAPVFVFSVIKGVVA